MNDNGLLIILIACFGIALLVFAANLCLSLF